MQLAAARASWLPPAASLSATLDGASCEGCWRAPSRMTARAGWAPLQVDAIARAIATAEHGSAERVDRELAAWGRWRDADAAEHYWLATGWGTQPCTSSTLVCECGEDGAWRDHHYILLARKGDNDGSFGRLGRLA